jgi:uncharacterized protein YegJ (DUF2314 family)
MKILLIVGALALVLAWLWSRRGRIEVDEEGVSQVAGDDKDMARAFAQAQQSLPEFLQRLADPRPADDSFGLKVAIRNDAGMVENLWITEVAVAGDVVTGAIGNDPVHVPYKLGDSWTGRLADVRDWTFADNGRLQGHFNLRAMLPRMPRAQREQFGRMLASRHDTRPLVHQPWPPDAAMPGEPLGYELSNGDAALMEAVPAHLEARLGAMPEVFHEIVSPSAHVDLYPFPARAGRDFHVIATTGMAEQAMQLPAGSGVDRHVELLLTLPSSWPLAHEQWLASEALFLPMRWLKRIARFHYETGRWLGEGHLLANGEPALPIDEGQPHDSAVLVAPAFLDGDDRVRLRDGREVRLLQVVFLRPQERESLQREGWEAFKARLDPARLSV